MYVYGAKLVNGLSLLVQSSVSTSIIVTIIINICSDDAILYSLAQFENCFLNKLILINLANSKKLQRNVSVDLITVGHVHVNNLERPILSLAS